MSSGKVRRAHISRPDPQLQVILQYTGTAGKVDNAQVAVYLTHASRHGHAVVDRELYVPRGWIGDADRRQAAGVPEQVGFATKPELARVMLAHAGGPPAAACAGRQVHRAAPANRRGAHPVAGLAEAVPPERWLTVNAGDGAKGRRWYAWMRVKLAADGPPAGWDRWLWVTLAMLAYAFLVVVALTECHRHPPPPGVIAAQQP